MEFNKVIKSETIELNLKGTNKNEILEELTDLLVKDGAISDKEGFLRDVYERESVCSTGIGSHVSIPHGKSKAVKLIKTIDKTLLQYYNLFVIQLGAE